MTYSNLIGYSWDHATLRTILRNPQDEQSQIGHIIAIFLDIPGPFASKISYFRHLLLKKFDISYHK